MSPDFVNALSAPIQHMSAAEIRAQQMKDMGIDERDISDVPVVRRHEHQASNGQITLTPSAGQQPQANNANAKKDEKKGELCTAFFQKMMLLRGKIFAVCFVTHASVGVLLRFTVWSVCRLCFSAMIQEGRQLHKFLTEVFLPICDELASHTLWKKEEKKKEKKLVSEFCSDCYVLRIKVF